MTAFDHVANSIQVALGKLDTEPTNQVVAVAEAIVALKEAKQLALNASAAYTAEHNAMKKAIADAEAKSAAKPPAPAPAPAVKHETFKSDAKHPSQPEKKK
jgi:hypothetical protein